MTVRRGAGLAALVVVAAAARARADEVDEIGKRVFFVESKAHDLGSAVRPSSGPGPEVAERRFIDAQLLYELKNYEDAAILLLDVIERFPSSRTYPEALFLLGDCQYKKRDYLSARRHFTQLVDRGPGSPGTPDNRRYQESLQRLIELSLATGDFGPVPGYLAKLSELPAGSRLPSVPYVEGKYYYFRKQYDDAAQAFEKIAPGTLYYLQARYFLATIRIARGDLPGATTIFQATAAQRAKNDEDKRILELTHMALGRVHYERSEFARAIDEYQKVPRESDLFPQMLYEVAWTHIKNKEYEKAYRALDLLLLAAPNAPEAPEVRILLANLEVRRGKLGHAMDLFQKARDEYDPPRSELESILAQHGRSSVYFHELIGKNLGRFDAPVHLPPLAVQAARRDPEVGRVTRIVGDISDMDHTVTDSEQLLVRLERATNSPARVMIFPDLAGIYQQSHGLGNQLLALRLQLGAIKRRLAEPGLGAAQKQELEALGGSRAELERRVGDLPKNQDDFTARTQKKRGEVERLDIEASRTAVGIQAMNAELVAAEKYYRDTQSTQKVPAAEFQRKAEEQRAAVQELEKQHTALLNQIQSARENTGVADSLVEEEAQARRGLDDLSSKERAAMAKAQGGLGSYERTKLDQIDSLQGRITAVDQTLTAVNTGLSASADRRLADIKTTLAEEKRLLGTHRANIEQYAKESSDVGGSIAFVGFSQVARRFYDIVVRGDVGMIDVAWANKQAMTDAAAKLKREETRDLTLLDEEFKDVLQEEK